MEVIKLFDIPKEIINDNERQRRVYSSDGISPTILGRSDNAKIMEVERIANLFGSDKGTGFAGNIWDKSKLSPTITTMQGGNRQPMIIDENIVIGGMQKHQAIKKDGICTTLTSSMGTGGGYVPMVLSDKSIVAMRGGNPDNPSDRTVGSPTEQRLEPNSQGICNTLTSVQKDNLVLEQNPIGSLYYGASESFGCGYMDNCYKTVKAEKDDLGVVESVKIKQATKDGYVECKIGGVADLSFPSSTTRRGRVQDNGDTCPTLMAGEQDICRIERNERFFQQALKTLETENCEVGDTIDAFNGKVNKTGVSPTITTRPEGFKTAILPVVEDIPKYNNNDCVDCDNCNHRKDDCLCDLSKNDDDCPLVSNVMYRIRKLTPMECWRLMDFTDEDFHKAEQVNSNTQLYKQAGNSICKNVLVAIFGQMLDGKEDVYKEINSTHFSNQQQ